MKTSQQILACFFFLALTIKEGLSLECYDCNSFSNEDCEKIGPNTPFKTCTANQTMCRKVEQQLYYNESDHVRVFRQCATRGTAGSCDTRTGTYRFKSWYCHCSGEKCNGSGSLSAPIISAVAIIIASLRKLQLL